MVGHRLARGGRRAGRGDRQSGRRGLVEQPRAARPAGEPRREGDPVAAEPSARRPAGGRRPARVASPSRAVRGAHRGTASRPLREHLRPARCLLRRRPRPIPEPPGRSPRTEGLRTGSRNLSGGGAARRPRRSAILLSLSRPPRRSRRPASSKRALRPSTSVRGQGCPSAPRPSTGRRNDRSTRC